MDRALRSPTALGLCLCAALVAGCGSDGRFVYTLAWNLEGVRRDDQAIGWSVTTDLGYEVRVDAGYLTSHSAELLACDRRTVPLVQLATWIAPRPAYATHALSLNPSAFHQARIESLARPRDSRTVRPVPAAEYCGVQYLVARAAGVATGLPEDIDMTARSLYLRGDYAAAEGMHQPFEITTTVAHGLRFDSDRIDGRDAPVAVRIERSLGRLFDGVDFAQSPEREWPRRILRNLIDSTVVAVDRPQGGGA